MIVLIGDLKPGMKLGADVKGANGRMLLPKGIVLEEQHLRVFNIWGVTEADIVEDSSGPDSVDQDEQELLDAARVHADALFLHAEMDVEPMSFIREACEKEYFKHLSDGETLPEPPSPGNGVCEIPSQPRFASVTEFIDSDPQLGVFPDIYYKIMKALDDPLSTATTLADIISKEPGICARLLSLVNSPLYGYGQPIDSLSRAVSILGTKGLSQLALGVTVMDRFKDLGDDTFSMADFWRHSLACAATSRILASQVPGTSQDLCFVVGMLHDLGRLVMLQLAPVESARIRENGSNCAKPLIQTEREVFGFDHCDVAAELFKKWNFPDDLAAAAIGHHGEMNGEPPVESAICAMADLLAIALQYGSNGTGFVHAPYPGAWDSLGLPQSALATTMGTAQRQINDILTVFMG